LGTDQRATLGYRSERNTRLQFREQHKVSDQTATLG